MPRFLRSRRTWVVTVIALTVGAGVAVTSRGTAPKGSDEKPTPTLEFAASDLTSSSSRPKNSV